MTTDNWITLASAAVGGSLVALGWFVNGYQNRLQDVAQKRLEYRLKALESMLPVFFAVWQSGDPFSQPGVVKHLEDARSKWQLYGHRDEIKVLERLISSIENQNLQGVNDALRQLAPLVVKRTREELKLEPLPDASGQ